MFHAIFNIPNLHLEVTLVLPSHGRDGHCICEHTYTHIHTHTYIHMLRNGLNQAVSFTAVRIMTLKFAGTWSCVARLPLTEEMGQTNFCMLR